VIDRISGGHGDFAPTAGAVPFDIVVFMVRSKFQRNPSGRAGRGSRKPWSP